MMGLTTNRTTEQRVVSVLLRVEKPLPISDIALKAKCSDQAVRMIIRKLRGGWGDRLIEEMAARRGAPMGKYKLLKQVGKKPVVRKQVSPLDLWRGWINPLTGITPEKLGL